MRFYYSFIVGILVTACQTTTQQTSTPKAKATPLELSDQFKSYWFSGLGEVNSYQLRQSRYGEQREGQATLIFVTEDFLTSKQVKANSKSDSSNTILKLNATKKFNTGIYPYSLMLSVFDPLTAQTHASKLSYSSQEWCGQTYMQLNFKNQFKIQSHSYFTNEADQNIEIEPVALEDELWTQLRINPTNLKTGNYKMLPSLAYFRLYHKPIEPAQVEVGQHKDSTNIITTINYMQLQRQLQINQDLKFPYKIKSWQSIVNKDTTSAQLKTSIQIDYWNKNSNQFLHLREALKLNL